MSRNILFSSLLLLLAMSLSPLCYAAVGADISYIGDALQGLVDILTGRTARLIAVLAVIGLGYATLSGRLAIKSAVTICLGIGIIFGATTITELLGINTA